MRKILVAVSLLIIAVTVVTSLFLPNFISYTMWNYLQNDMKAHNIQGEIQTHPSFMIGTGRIDEISYKADSAVIGQTEVYNLSLTGTGVYINMPDLLQQRFTINKAENITLSCSIDEKSLEKLLLKRINRLRNANVRIEPQFVVIKANIPLLGNDIATTIRGNLYTRDGNIYFKIAEFDVENDLLGKISMDTKEDILLIDKNKLPFDAAIDTVTQEENQIFVKASTHKE